MPRYTHLADRAVLAVTGEDARAFLQGLITNDVMRIEDERAIYAALLTPQGKYLHDFFIAPFQGRLLLDCEQARLADLRRRLGIYRLRAKVAIEADGTLAVFALAGAGVGAPFQLDGASAGAASPVPTGVVFVDPRLADLGLRAILPAAAGGPVLTAAGLSEAGPDTYDRLRLALGVADGSRDMQIEKSILLECGFDELHGIDWEKGCYVGQEVTARSKYRGLVKKRLVPVTVVGSLPPPGTPIRAGGAEVGEVRSGREDRAIALIRLEPLRRALAGEAILSAADARLLPEKPAWASF